MEDYSGGMKKIIQKCKQKACSMDRRPIAMTLFGCAIMGLGIALIKMSFLGSDPYTAMVIALGDKIGVDFSLILRGINCLCFLVQWCFGRELIGLGTFVNWILVGPLASFLEKVLLSVGFIYETFWPRLFLMLLGVLVLSLACALYQTADKGVAPYDALSIILARKSKISYFGCRFLTDLFCAVSTFLLGGLLSIGTVVCVAGLGPFISFFSKNIASPLILSGEKRKN